MSSSSDWEMPVSVQPKPENYAFDLDGALNALVGLRAIVPADAFTAETLGTERTGNGVLIRDGVVLTIGYLITEAETIWLHLADGRAAPGGVSMRWWLALLPSRNLPAIGNTCSTRRFSPRLHIRSGEAPQ